MRDRLFAGAAAVLFLVTLTAHADTVYTSQSAYNAAVNTTTTITFNGIAPAGSFVTEPNPFTLSGSTFSFSPGSSAFIIDPAYYGSSYSGGGFLTVDYTTPTDTLTVTLPSVRAVSFDFGGLFGTGDPFAVTLSDGVTISTVTTNGITGTDALTFLGVTTTTPITSITFTLPDTPNYNAVDNISYGTLVPEPSSLLLLGTGLLGAAGALRRRIS